MILPLELVKTSFYVSHGGKTDIPAVEPLGLYANLGLLFLFPILVGGLLFLPPHIIFLQ